MKIKDENGTVVAEINLQEGFSITDLVKNLGGKSSKSCFNNLLKIEESEDKKQIVFKFNDGQFYYDLPSKIIVKGNGLKIGETSLSKTKLNIKNRMIRVLHYERNTFWLELAKKTDVPWIKTFFGFVDIWASQKHKKHGWVDSKKQSKRCKIQSLNSNKVFFDSIESFSKLPEVQKFSEEDLIKLYDGLLENSEYRSSSADSDAFYLHLKKAKLDNWFFENCKKDLSENYFESETLLNHIGGYICCVKNNLKNQFKYVFETYGGAINTSQVKLINGLIKMGYEPTRLMDYLYRDVYNQGLDLGFNHKWAPDAGALQLLFDYANMNKDMKKEYEKYPRYLSTFHDITSKNYKIKEDEILNQKFQHIVDEIKNDKICYSNEEYVVILPESIKDLVNEGQNLSHCVASYYKRMANNETCIVFLRKKENIKKSLVTIEIKNNKIVQAKGMNNAEPREKEKDFLKEYGDYLTKISCR